jgi:hypothetical protein
MYIVTVDEKLDRSFREFYFHQVLNHTLNAHRFPDPYPIVCT